MIVAQIALVLAVVGLGLYFLGRNGNKQAALKKMLIFVFIIIAIIFIIKPDLADVVAHSVGIGRGADMIFYATTLVLAFSLVNNSIIRKAEEKNQSKLIRKVSLLQKEIKELSDKVSKSKLTKKEEE